MSEGEDDARPISEGDQHLKGSADPNARVVDPVLHPGGVPDAIVDHISSLGSLTLDHAMDHTRSRDHSPEGRMKTLAEQEAEAAGAPAEDPDLDDLVDAGAMPEPPELTSLVADPTGAGVDPLEGLDDEAEKSHVVETDGGTKNIADDDDEDE